VKPLASGLLSGRPSPLVNKTVGVLSLPNCWTGPDGRIGDIVSYINAPSRRRVFGKFWALVQADLGRW
jgi:hypothetical protein